MKCSIIINYGTDGLLKISDINDKLIYGDGNIPVEDLYKNISSILNGRKDWNDFVQDLLTYMTSNSAVISDVRYSDILKSENLVPNVNIKYLQDMYPDITFPKDMNVNILLLDNLDRTLEGGVQGRVLDTNGKEIFVVNGSKNSILKLANYLKIRSEVSSKTLDSLIDDLRDELDSILELLKDDNIKTREDLVIAYLNNKDKFIKSLAKSNTGRSALLVLRDVGDTLQSKPVKSSFGNPLVDEFVGRFKYGKDSATIDLGYFCGRYLKDDILKGLCKALDLTSLDKFLNFINRPNSEIIEDIESVLDKEFNDKELEFIEYFTSNEDDAWGVDILFSWILGLIPLVQNPIRYTPSKLTNKELLLKSSYPSLKRIYGFNYETVKSFVLVKTVGNYNIYIGEVKGNKAYFISKYQINEYASSLAYLTEDDAVEACVKATNNEKLADAALIDLKKVITDGSAGKLGGRTFISNTFIPSTTIISTIDMPVITSGMLNSEFVLLLDSYQEFVKYINSLDINIKTKDYITDNIDNAEKAAIFLSELNLRLNIKLEDGSIVYDRKDVKKMVEIVNDIKKADYKYFYIKNSVNTANGKRYSFIPTNKSLAVKARENPRVPVIQLLESIAYVMLEKFKVPIHVLSNEDFVKLTSSEYLEELKAKEDLSKFEQEDIVLAESLLGMEIMSTVKAFIHNGEIFINSSVANAQDAYHEYAHLLLGVLKSNPLTRLLYIELLKRVISTESANLALEAKRKLYPNRSYYDLAEEVFADMYGKYIDRNTPYELTRLFDESYIIKSVEYNVFDLQDEPVTDFGVRTLGGFWERFNSNVASTLKDRPTFLKEGDLQMQRRKANWLEKLIEDKKIIENCVS